MSTTNSSYVDTSDPRDWLEQLRKQQAPRTTGQCPSCGYCPHCGRGPVYPVYPVYPTYPVQPWYPSTTWC